MADIAERAGVALSTVSYVLSGKRSVSEETRQRVFQAIADLDYQPHAMARSLASKRTRTIGLLFPALNKLQSEMRLEFVSRAAQAATEHEYAFLLWTAPDNDADILQLTQQGRVDGLILMEIKLHDQRVALLRERNVPFTMIGHCEDNQGISFVDLDFAHAITIAVEHLAELGHRTIALYNHSAAQLADGYGPSVRSLQGFERAIAGLGLRGIAVSCEHTFESGFDTTKALLEQHPDLSAVVVMQESTISGIIQALHGAGLSIPDDFSLVAFLSPRLATIMTPSLTTIDFPAAEMGRIGTEMLIQRLEGQTDQPVQQMLRADLTVRQTSAPRRPRPGSA